MPRRAGRRRRSTRSTAPGPGRIERESCDAGWSLTDDPAMIARRLAARRARHGRTAGRAGPADAGDDRGLCASSASSSACRSAASRRSSTLSPTPGRGRVRPRRRCWPPVGRSPRRRRTPRSRRRLAKVLRRRGRPPSRAPRIQCHGAIGYTTEYDLHLFAKRAWALVPSWGDAPGTAIGRRGSASIYDRPTRSEPDGDSDDVVLYEQDGPIARVTLNRPEYGNAQNSEMTYALDDAFYRAAADDEVKVIVPGRRGQALLGRPRHRHAGPGHRPVVPPAGRAVVGPRRQGRRREPVRPRAGGLPGDVPALAGTAQADDRPGARRVHRRRADAGLDLRPDRRLRRCVLRRPGGADGHPRRGVLRPPVGDGAAAGQGVPVPRRADRRRAGAAARHGQPGRSARRAGRRGHRRWPTRSPRCRASGWR